MFTYCRIGTIIQPQIIVDVQLAEQGIIITHNDFPSPFGRYQPKFIQADRVTTNATIAYTTRIVTTKTPATRKYMQLKSTARPRAMRTTSSSLVSKSVFTCREWQFDGAPKQICVPDTELWNMGESINTITFAFIAIKKFLPSGRVQPESFAGAGDRPLRRAQYEFKPNWWWIDKKKWVKSVVCFKPEAG